VLRKVLRAGCGEAGRRLAIRRETGPAQRKTAL